MTRSRRGDRVRRPSNLLLPIALFVVSAAYACVEPDRDSLTRSETNANAPEPRDDLPLPAHPADAGPSAAPLPTDAFASAKSCASCHSAIYAQWSTSMHSRSLTGPIMIAQTNQGIRGPYAATANPDPKRLCVNCHSPSAARVTTSPTLPLGDDSTLWREGVSCQTCHQFDGPAASGSAGYSTGFMKHLKPGTRVFGPLSNPAPSAAHSSGTSDGFERPNTMCGNCHNVNYDNDRDGQIVRGTDLVLQQTWDEYVTDYKAVGGTGTCISCHMPAVAGLDRVVDAPPAGTPPRVVRDHSFVGVDYALDDATHRTQTRPARTALLRSAATIAIEPGSAAAGPNAVTFRVAITNSNTGHNLPTGFAFARQMWLEVRALDAQGAVVASSGVLTSPSADLCESEVLGDTANPLATSVSGCSGVDASLVHFQQKLVSGVEPLRDAQGNVTKDHLGQPIVRATAASREVLLQLLPGGVVARRRPVDTSALAALRPFETRSFAYSLPTNGAAARRVVVRLLFRALPPYFVRGLATAQPQDVPDLASLAENLDVIEMASATFELP